MAKPRGSTRTTPKRATKPVKAAAKRATKTTKRAAEASTTARPTKPSAKAKPSPKARPTSTTAKGGINVGKRAPRFQLKDEKGKLVTSDALAGAPYVLYFYPKDDTSGCTKEACGFRDASRHFGKQKVRVIGVSPDSEASHARFAQKYGLPFTLLADPDKVLAKAYGVWVLKKNYGREYMGINRSTFVVDAQGIVRKVFRSVKVNGHVNQVLAVASTL